MKQVLIALLTTTINRYSKYAVNGLSKDDVVEDLTNLLDYVTDIPEESQEPITVVLNSSELQNLKRENKALEEHKMQAFKYQQQLICRIEELKNRKNELEETCVANNEIIDTQFKKINELKDTNYIWQNACNDLRDKNEGLKEMIERARRIVTLRDDTIYNLKEKLVKAKEHGLPFIDFQKIYDAAQEMEGN
ncbi:hypothetical protein KPL28_02850 [Clostridium algidicarnis]|uniref:hypothetical protein n=1 Tax=Clostridium algidicarnis TaxID=37659 RepID=UPI001C0D7CD6|nr:hypothetical protein [Clostridium algidicarnis]MBU3208573.1 hypothetical protein [Clostridium algidicarnis]